MSALNEMFDRFLQEANEKVNAKEFEYFVESEPSKEFLEELRKKYEEWESKFNFILLNLIPNPIKGEITIGKLRYRGITLGRTVIDGHIVDIDVSIRPSSKRNREWHFCYSKDWTEEIEYQYQFCLSADKVMAFGASARKKGEYKVSGIIPQIYKQ